MIKLAEFSFSWHTVSDKIRFTVETKPRSGHRGDQIWPPSPKCHDRREARASPETVCDRQLGAATAPQTLPLPVVLNGYIAATRGTCFRPLLILRKLRPSNQIAPV